MAITTMAMVATVFVLNLYGMKDKPVPLWAKKIFVVYLARILCMCNCMAPQEHRHSETGETKRQAANRKYRLVGKRTQKYDYNDCCLPGDQEPCGSTSTKSFAHVAANIQRRSGSVSHDNTTPFLNDTRPVERKAWTKPDYNKDWVHVAAVCDRFFFWLCLIFIVITTLLLFHPLTTSRYFKIPILEDRKGLK